MALNFVESSVNPVADAQIGGEGFDVNVGGTLVERLADDEGGGCAPERAPVRSSAFHRVPARSRALQRAPPRSTALQCASAADNSPSELITS